MECRVPAGRTLLCVVLSVVLTAEHAYWWLRAGRRVRGDSFFIPLATRWLYVLGSTKLVSAAIGFATIGAAVDVVPLVGPRTVWNVLKVVLGCTDFVFGYIDTSAFPHRPALMPMLLVFVVAATWLAPVLSVIFVWFVIGTDSPATICLSDVSDAAAVALTAEAASLLLLPIIDVVGGGLAKDGAPMCLRDPTKASHPRIAFGRTGAASGARVHVLMGGRRRDSVLKDSMNLVSSAWEQWTPERLDSVILAIELSRRNGQMPARRHSAPTDPKGALAQLRQARSPGARSRASHDSGMLSADTAGRAGSSASPSRRVSLPTGPSLPSRDSPASSRHGGSVSPAASLRVRSADAFGVSAAESVMRGTARTYKPVRVPGAAPGVELRPAVHTNANRAALRGGPTIHVTVVPAQPAAVPGSPLRKELRTQW